MMGEMPSDAAVNEVNALIELISNAPACKKRLEELKEATKHAKEAERDANKAITNAQAEIAKMEAAHAKLEQDTDQAKLVENRRLDAIAAAERAADEKAARQAEEAAGRTQHFRDLERAGREREAELQRWADDLERARTDIARREKALKTAEEKVEARARAVTDDEARLGKVRELLARVG
jgi:chromosome segregation ATPase